MVVIDRQRRRPGEPKYLSALDLDGWYEGHEHSLIVIRVVDDFQIRILRHGGRGTEKYGAYAEDGEPESDAKRLRDSESSLPPIGKIGQSQVPQPDRVRRRLRPPFCRPIRAGAI
jgi:hypothetical protein